MLAKNLLKCDWLICCIFHNSNDLGWNISFWFMITVNVSVKKMSNKFVKQTESKNMHSNTVYCDSVKFDNINQLSYWCNGLEIHKNALHWTAVVCLSSSSLLKMIFLEHIRLSKPFSIIAWYKYCLRIHKKFHLRCNVELYCTHKKPIDCLSTCEWIRGKG